MINHLCQGNTYVRALNDEEIEGLRVACQLGRQVLDEAAAAVAVGVTTDEIDRIVHEATVDRECYPSPLNYYQACSYYISDPFAL